MSLLGSYKVAISAVLEGADKLGQEISGALGGGLTSKINEGATVAVAGFTAAGLAGKSFVDAALESQKVADQTSAVLKSTGGVSGVTAKEVGDLAGAISEKTGVDDEAIQTGQNLLLTFKNIRNEAGKGNDIFNQSTQTLVDMAAAMGNDPKSAAIQLGKALNDPVKGIGALSRVGVTFSGKQEKVIKKLVKTGKTAEAQKIILKELNSEFGGSAKAQGNAADKMAVAWGNLQEEIGAALLPLFNKFAKIIMKDVIPAIRDFVGFVQEHETLFKTLAGLVAAFGAAFIVAAGALKVYSATMTIVSAVTKTATAIQAAWALVMALNPVVLIVLAIIALIAVIVLIAKKTDWFSKIWDAVWGAVKKAFFATWGAIKAFGIAVWNGLKTAFTAVWGAIKTLFMAYLNFYKTIFITAWKAIKAVGMAIWNGIKAAFGAIWNGIKAVFFGVLNAFKAYYSFIWNQIVVKTVTTVMKIASTLKTWFTNGINAVVNLVSGLWGRISGFFTSIPGKIKSAIGDLSSVGKAIVEGIWKGISGATGWLMDQIKGFGSTITDGVKSVFGVNSPSRVMRDEVGKYLGLGIGVGMMDSLATVTKQAEQFSDRLSSSTTAKATRRVTHLDMGNGGMGGKTINQTFNVPAPKTNTDLYLAAKRGAQGATV